MAQVTTIMHLVAGSVSEVVNNTPMDNQARLLNFRDKPRYLIVLDRTVLLDSYVTKPFYVSNAGVDIDQITIFENGDSYIYGTNISDIIGYDSNYQIHKMLINENTLKVTSSLDVTSDTVDEHFFSEYFVDYCTVGNDFEAYTLKNPIALPNHYLSESEEGANFLKVLAYADVSVTNRGITTLKSIEDSYYPVEVVTKPESLIKGSSFDVADGCHYYIEHPVSIESGSVVSEVYTFSPSIVLTSSYPYQLETVFTNNPNGYSTNDDQWATGWGGHAFGSMTPGRIVIDFGEVVDLTAVEFQGQFWTGYYSDTEDNGYGHTTGYKLVSGPKDTTFRFSTAPFNNTVDGNTGNVANIAHSWGNLDIGANTSSPNGLAEILDIKALNGGSAVSCRYFALDVNTSHDGRNMGVRHILFQKESPVASAPITATVGSDVNSFTIQDSNGNTNSGSPTDINIGADTFRLGSDTMNEIYHGRRVGSQFILSGSDGTITKGNV